MKDQCDTALASLISNDFDEVMWICSSFIRSVLRKCLCSQDNIGQISSQDEILQLFAVWAFSMVLDTTSASSLELCREKPEESSYHGEMMYIVIQIARILLSNYSQYKVTLDFSRC